MVVSSVGCLAWLAPGCGGGGGGGTAAATGNASITGFTAAASTVLLNQSTTLTPVFSGGTGRIDPGIGVVTSGSPVSTGPLAADTTFTLTVSGAGPAKTQALPVKVVSIIDSFSASASTLTQGGTTNLTAVFTGSGSIDHGVGPVTSGTPVTSPALDSDVTYTLSVTNALGTQTQALPVKVVPAAAIQDFRASAPAVSVGRSATLTAVFTGGTGSIDHGVGPVTSGVALATGAVNVATTWTLTVTNALGQVATRTLALDAVPLPVITDFAPALQNVTLTGAEAGTSLLAHYTGGVASINRGIGAVSSGVPARTGPARSKVNAYKLTVTNLAGDSVTATTAVYGPNLAMTSYRTLASLKSDGTLWSMFKTAADMRPTTGATPRLPAVMVPGLGKVVSVALNVDNGGALVEDGTVWEWFPGSIQYGNSTPRKVTGLPRIMALEIGGFFSVALAEDGTVWTWGYNDHGELGDGTTAWRPTPARVPGLPTIVSLAAGKDCVFAVDATGTVWAWGDNSYGQLGIGTRSSTLRPTAIQGLTGVVEVAAGGRHMALKADGTLVDVAQLGSGPDFGKIAGCSDAVAIASGGVHCLILKEDGTVAGLGDNSLGQCGSANTGGASPVAVPGLTGVVAVDASGHRSLALKADGTLWAFGDNECGFLEDVPAFQISPTLQNGTNWTTISAIGTQTLALKADGSLWTSGSDYGTFGLRTGTPTQIQGLAPAVGMAGNLVGGVAIGLDGWPSEWGGFLIRGANVQALSEFPQCLAVAGGTYYSLFLAVDHQVWAAGINDLGPLGAGTGNMTMKAAKVGLDNVVAIAAGFDSCAAIKADGTLWCWGLSKDSSPVVQTIPIQIPWLTHVRSVVVGRNFYMVLKDDGTVWGWGYNSGVTPNLNDFYPIQIPGLSGVVALAAGSSHCLALHADGTVSSWGSNQYGQLGKGTFDSTAVPQRVPGVSGVTAIAAGDDHSVALSDSGTYAWGDDSLGQLGLGRLALSRVPLQIKTGKLW